MMTKTKKTITFIILLGSILLFSISCKNDVAHKKLDTETEEKSNRDLFSIGEFTTPASINALEENLSGELIVLTEEDFVLKVTDIDKIKGFQYKGNTPCIVDFHADWCRPCRQLNPVLIELAKEYKGKVIFYKINTDRSPNVSNAFNINFLPTLFFFKRHDLPTKIEGAPSKEDLINAIDEILLSEKR